MMKADNRTNSLVTLAVVAMAALLSAGVVLSDETDAPRDERSWGQRGGGPGFGPGPRMRDPSRMIQRLASFLELTDTQEQALNNIADASKPEFEALRDRARANFSAMRALSTDDPDYSAKLSNLAAENGALATEGTLLAGRVRAEVNAELTPEQRATLDARIQEGRERRGRGRRHGKRSERGGSQ